MRSFIPLILIAAVSGCTAAAPPAMTPLTPQQQNRLNQLIGGKVAGPPQSCLSNWRTQDMTVIDDNTIIFRQAGGNRVWVQKPRQSCQRLSGPSYALVTRSTVNQLCSGDIAQVVDTSANMTVSSCVMGDFIPYTQPGS